MPPIVSDSPSWSIVLHLSFLLHCLPHLFALFKLIIPWLKKRRSLMETPLTKKMVALLRPVMFGWTQMMPSWSGRSQNRNSLETHLTMASKGKFGLPLQLCLLLRAPKMILLKLQANVKTIGAMWALLTHFQPFMYSTHFGLRISFAKTFWKCRHYKVHLGLDGMMGQGLLSYQISFGQTM